MSMRFGCPNAAVAGHQVDTNFRGHPETRAIRVAFENKIAARIRVMGSIGHHTEWHSKGTGAFLATVVGLGKSNGNARPCPYSRGTNCVRRMSFDVPGAVYGKGYGRGIDGAK